ncbi:MAG: winged helix-turn-helix domain-containing protein [Rhabdochlamydiaceae bacterium]|nr:winged helix-turn-helix domain-containing protein [Rhabdochlamydiaceae bacterium]
MLKGLFGNQNIERILLFLFVNEKTYASQIHSLLQVPLTPLQMALSRLEKEGILLSSCEQKIRIYQFHPAFPLRQELEILLKKAYELLPPQEKRRYCFFHKPREVFPKELDLESIKTKELILFWERLHHVKQLSFSTRSKILGKQETKNGLANVTVKKSSNTIIFQEKGYWICNTLPEHTFSNCFRWTLDKYNGYVSLEHLRYGIDHPVFLFHLTPTRPFVLEPVDAHLCREDMYLGNILWNSKQIDFHWRVIGPSKNDYLEYRYT